MANNNFPRALTAEEQKNTQRACEKVVKQLWQLDEYSLSDVCYSQHQKYQQGIHAMADILMCEIENVWVNKTNGDHPKQIDVSDLRRVLRRTEKKLAEAANLRGASKTQLRTAVMLAMFKGGE